MGYQDEFVSDYIVRDCRELVEMDSRAKINVGLARVACAAALVTDVLVFHKLDTHAKHRLARYTRHLYALTRAADIASANVRPLVYNEDKDRFEEATCPLCPSAPDSPRLNGLCRACDMAEHGEGIEEAREMLHSESEVD